MNIVMIELGLCMYYTKYAENINIYLLEIIKANYIDENPTMYKSGGTTMPKDITTEVLEELRSMKEDEKEKFAEELLQGNPTAWMEKIFDIARNHQMTVAEFATLLGVSPSSDPRVDAKILAEYEKNLRQQ